MTRRIFFGAAAMAIRSAMGQDILQRKPPPPDARVAYGTGRLQFGELRLPAGPGPHPVLIFIHGGFWSNAYNLDHAGHACAAIAHAGMATWSLEYRRVGDAGGGWPGTLDDVVHGAEHVVGLAARYHLEPQRILAAGHSAGGQLAVWLAAQRAVDLRGVVSLAGVLDLRRAWALNLGGGAVGRFLGGSPDQFPQRYAAASPQEVLPISVPQSLIHGTADDLVPFEMSERFAMASHNAKLVPIKGAGHFDLIDPGSKAWPTVTKTILNWQF